MYKFFFHIKSTVSLTWDGWQDDLSGLAKFNFEVFEMKPLKNSLQENAKLPNGTASRSLTMVKFQNIFVFSSFNIFFSFLHIDINDCSLQKECYHIFFFNFIGFCHV